MRRIGLLIILYWLQPNNGFAQEVTYHQHIAPIIQAKCVTCHRPGESAPFNLLTYEDVSKKGSFIKKVVQSGFMPPWKADNSYVHFANDRSLTQEQISLIAKWVDDKMPEGKDPGKKAKTISSPAIEGTSFNRKPDLVLLSDKGYTVKGDNVERFIIFKIPFELKDSASVEAIEFISNNKKLVHHANYAVHAVPDESIDIKSTDGQINLTDDDRRKFDQYQPYRKTITYYGGWIPGTTYEYYPKEFGWVMPKRGVILLTVHYAPSAVEAESITGVNLFFKKEKVTRPVKIVSFGSGGIGEDQIKPAFYIEPNYVKKFSLKLMNPGEDQSVLYVWPHMHLIGKQYKAYAVAPGGDTIRLVNIPDWDFRWQEIYRFKKPVRIPRGSVIHVEGTYDNTANNPFNPFNPPQFILSQGDMKTTDEMMTLMMAFLPYREGDENISLE
ncbi:MAG: cytochrome c [Agriterribacter sp.]